MYTVVSRQMCVAQLASGRREIALGRSTASPYWRGWEGGEVRCTLLFFPAIPPRPAPRKPSSGFGFSGTSGHVRFFLFSSSVSPRTRQRARSAVNGRDCLRRSGGLKCKVFRRAPGFGVRLDKNYAKKIDSSTRPPTTVTLSSGNIAVKKSRSGTDGTRVGTYCSAKRTRRYSPLSTVIIRLTQSRVSGEPIERLRHFPPVRARYDYRPKVLNRI